MVELQNEVKKLRRNLDEAVQTRDLYNVCSERQRFACLFENPGKQLSMVVSNHYQIM